MISFFHYLNGFFQPVYYTWNNYDTTHGIYEEPKDTIEVLFLGSSYTVSGVIPIELYEEYGICAYNMGTEQQPMLASYYWLKEIYESHSETLKTVVIDPTRLLYPPDEFFMRKSMDGMRLSENKVNAWKDFEAEENLLYRVVPLFAYHRRWIGLNQTDFAKGDHVLLRYNRGYWLRTSFSLQEKAYSEIPIPQFYLDEAASADALSEESLEMFGKIAAFCREHDLHLIVSKTPTPAWDSADHNAVLQALDGDMVFLDSNYPPLQDALTFDPAVDICDNWHLNYYGATKYTDWIGNYLIQNGLATDVRGQDKYSFLEDQLQEWHENVTIPEPQIDEETLRLYNRRCENAKIESYLNVTGGKSDLETYLKAYWDLDSRVIFLAKCGEATGLDQASRRALEALGLNGLSSMDDDNYIGIVDEGKIVTERSSSRFDSVAAEGDNYSITSGYAPGATSIQINGQEYFGGTPGLTVVIFDKELNTVVSQAVFS